MPNQHEIAGRCILVVEDEFLLASTLADLLQQRGAEVIGPFTTVDQAIGRIKQAERLDGALLDVNLRGEISFAVADALASRGVPFAFTTGYDDSEIPPRFAEVPCHQKPFDVRHVVSELLR